MKTLVVDKTGTLTEGKPKLLSVAPLGTFANEKEVLRLAASLEQASEHPLAHAIVVGAKERELPLAKVSQFESITGKGVPGIIEGRTVLLGNRALLDVFHIPADEIASQAEKLRADGQTVMLLAIDGQPAGLIGVADPIASLC